MTAGSAARRRAMRIARVLLSFGLMLLVAATARAQFVPSGELEIRYINVGQGGSTLIIGPDGTRILYDFGNKDGRAHLVPYLQNVLGLQPDQGFDYTFVSHGDRDHYFGFKDVIGGPLFRVKVANYGPGGPKTEMRKASALMKKQWLTPAEASGAGAVKSASVGDRIPLGNGAEAVIAAANGRVIGQDAPIKVVNENDRSVFLFVTYKNFQYILDGDLGAGPESCSGHQTTQKNIEVPVAQALIQLGLMPADRGVDVLHVAHHGSESSTSAAYFNLVKPQVALISVGLNQPANFLHPRADVVDKVLLGGGGASCVTAPPVSAVFQTEDGVEGCAETGCTSLSGRPIGDIKLSTDGIATFTIEGTNDVTGGRALANEGPWVFNLD